MFWKKATETMETKSIGNVHIRWMIRRDMPAVLAIENACFDNPWSVPWTEEEFIQSLRQRNNIGMTVERVDTDEIVGFMIYGLSRHCLDLLDLAVAPEYQRHGIGTAMIDELVSKLSPDRRRRLSICVSERNTPTHLFLRAVSGSADRIYRDYFDGFPDDMYEFVIPYRDEARSRNSDVRDAQEA